MHLMLMQLLVGILNLPPARLDEDRHLIFTKFNIANSVTFHITKLLERWISGESLPFRRRVPGNKELNPLLPIPSQGQLCRVVYRQTGKTQDPGLVITMFSSVHFKKQWWSRTGQEAVLNAMALIIQGCKFSGNCLNSGLHEAQIPTLLFIFSPFWRLLAQIHTLFQAFSLRSAYIPDYRLMTAYLFLRVNCDKIMHARWDFDASSARTRRVSVLDKYQNWSASELFCQNFRA